MAAGMWRGVAGGVLSLVVLQALVDAHNQRNVGGLLNGVGVLFQRALDPQVPAIPDRTGVSAPPAPTGNAPGGGTATVGPDGRPNGGQITPDGRYLPPTDSTQTQPNPAQTHLDAYSYVPVVPGALRA